jgi:GAF domain-containing protein
MSAPRRPVGPESFTQLARCLETGAAHEPRVESLFENLLGAQQEVFGLMLGGAALNDILARLATVFDRVVAPARCSISLFDKTAGRLTHHAGPHLWPELKPSAEVSAAHAPGPIEAALVQGERIVAADFQIETRWPIFAGKALVRGLRACWAEPADCDDGIAVVLALFHAEPAQPSATDGRALKAAASMAAFAAKASRRGQSRGIYAQGPRRSH